MRDNSVTDETKLKWVTEFDELVGKTDELKRQLADTSRRRTDIACLLLGLDALPRLGNVSTQHVINWLVDELVNDSVKFDGDEQRRDTFYHLIQALDLRPMDADSIEGTQVYEFYRLLTPQKMETIQIEISDLAITIRKV